MQYRTPPNSAPRRRRAAPGKRHSWVLLAVAALLAGPAPLAQESDAPDGDDAEHLQLSSDLRVTVRRGRDIELELMAAEGDDYTALARRAAGAEETATAIAAWNGERSIAPGDWIRVPLSLLSARNRSLVLRNLFPQDHPQGRDWIHMARAGVLPIYDEGLWQVSEWFTGNGANFTALMAVNRLSSPELRSGQAVRIPAELAHPAFQSRMRSEHGELEYHRDARGPYAGYRLRAGEALYSSVIVRFTGRTAASDVTEVAELLRQRSDIRDLRDIPVGYEIKIPLELIEPEFLPAGHPRRQEAEEARAELERVLARQPLRGAREGLSGVLVILDPGHGGRDLGTINNGIWEHDYVYDVACRLKQRLEQQTNATVRMTLIDAKTGCTPSRTDKLSANHQGTIQTHPPFLATQNGEAKIGVNLRWYLANSIYRKALADGHDKDRVIFVSLHADSRHPSLRGLMVYVPGAGYRTKTYGFSSKTYMRYAEVREKPTVRFSRNQRVRSEAVSRELADAVVRSFREAGLPVQPYQPVRHRIIRGQQRFIPAVLRGNTVPTKVLVEMVNLSNPEDAELLASARERDRISEGLLNSLLDYFGDGARTSR